VEFFLIMLIALTALWTLFNIHVRYYAVGLNGLFSLLMGNVFVGLLQIALHAQPQGRDGRRPAQRDVCFLADIHPGPDT
jgi:hypothetical protein